MQPGDGGDAESVLLVEIPTCFLFGIIKPLSMLCASSSLLHFWPLLCVHLSSVLSKRALNVVLASDISDSESITFTSGPSAKP